MSFSTTVPLAILGTVAAIVGTVVALLSYRRSRAHQAPELRLKGGGLMLAKHDAVPRALVFGITNTGSALAKDIRLVAWLFMVPEEKFTVPGDEELSIPHYTYHVTSLQPGETMSVEALRSGEALSAAEIPEYDPDAMAFYKVTVRYRDRFKKDFVERNVFSALPLGHELTGYDFRPTQGR